MGGDLSPERLLAAYRNGIFPWYGEDDPILWWSPDPRMLLFPEKIHVARRLRRVIRRHIFEVTADTAFKEVIENCAAAPRSGQKGTWILPEMIQAYKRLHRLGYAHSVEVRRDGELVGGLYGVSVGACFFGESMYSQVSNASKIAMAALMRQCRRWEFAFMDCQMPTPHLTRMGAEPVPRATFLKLLQKALRRPTRRGLWQMDADIFSDI